MEKQTGNSVVDSMKTYTGTKTIKATPMTKAEYLEYRGWDLPDGENPEEKVMLVEYAPDPKSEPNHPDHAGYISMSPMHVFNEAYKPSETFFDRLIIEGDELCLKMEKLRDAINSGKVPQSEVSILETQLSAMSTYLNVLRIRREKLTNQK